MARGIIQKPVPTVLRRTIRVKEARIERLSRLPADNEIARDKIARERSTLEKMRGSFAKQFGYDPTNLEEGYQNFADEIDDSFPSQDDEAPPEPKASKAKVDP